MKAQTVNVDHCLEPIVSNGVTYNPSVCPRCDAQYFQRQPGSMAVLDCPKCSWPSPDSR